jgi:hypothetical protein
MVVGTKVDGVRELYINERISMVMRPQKERLGGHWVAQV